MDGTIFTIMDLMYTIEDMQTSLLRGPITDDFGKNEILKLESRSSDVDPHDLSTYHALLTYFRRWCDYYIKFERNSRSENGGQ